MDSIKFDERLDKISTPEATDSLDDSVESNSFQKSKLVHSTLTTPFPFLEKSLSRRTALILQ